MLAQRAFNLVQPALTVAQGVEGGEISGELFALSTGVTLFGSLDVFADKIEQVAPGEEILAGGAAGYASEQRAHGLVRFDHDGQGLIRAGRGDAVDHVVLDALGYTETDVREDPAQVLGQGAVHGFSEHSLGFAALAPARTKGAERLEVVGVPTPSHASGQALENRNFVLPLAHGLDGGRQFTVFQRGLEKNRLGH